MGSDPIFGLGRRPEGRRFFLWGGDSGGTPVVHCRGSKTPDKSTEKTQIVTPFLSRLAAIGLTAFGMPLALHAQAPAAPGAAPAAPAVATQDDKITVNFVNADIQSVIKTVGQHTGIALSEGFLLQQDHDAIIAAAQASTVPLP